MTATRECSKFEWERHIRTADIPSQAKLVAYALVTWMSADGSRCWPGQDAIALACGWSKSDTVREWTRWLKDNHLLRIVRHGGVRRKGRAQATHLYVPLLPVDAQQSDEPDGSHDQPPPPRGLNGDDGHDQPPLEHDQPPRASDQHPPPRGEPSSSNQPSKPTREDRVSPIGLEKVKSKPDSWLSYINTAKEKLGPKTAVRLQNEAHVKRNKLRAAVKEQVEAGADPVKLAKVTTEQDVRDAKSVCDLLAHRVNDVGPELARMARGSLVGNGGVGEFYTDGQGGAA